MRKNRFIANIENGSIPDAAALKDRYRMLVMETHPDHAGQSRIEEFFGLEDEYREALQQLHAQRSISGYEDENVRFLFFQELRKIDGLESPYCLDKDLADERLRTARSNAERYFRHWRGESTLFSEMLVEHDVLKHEKKKNSLAELYKPRDFERIRPLSFSLTYYHLTGQPFYRIQIKRLRSPVLQLFSRRGLSALHAYYTLLADDIVNGPAIEG